MIHKSKFEKAQADCQLALNGTIENHTLAWIHCTELEPTTSIFIGEHDKQQLEIPYECTHFLSQWQPPGVTDVVEFDHAHLKYEGKVLKPKQSLGYLTPHILRCIKQITNIALCNMLQEFKIEFKITTILIYFKIHQNVNQKFSCFS